MFFVNFTWREDERSISHRNHHRHCIGYIVYDPGEFKFIIVIQLFAVSSFQGNTKPHVLKQQSITSLLVTIEFVHKMLGR